MSDDRAEFADECARLVIARALAPDEPTATSTRALAWWYCLSERTAEYMREYAQWHSSPKGRALNGGKPE